MQSGQVNNNDNQDENGDDGRHQHAGTSGETGWGQGSGSAYEKFQRHEHSRNKSRPSDDHPAS